MGSSPIPATIVGDTMTPHEALTYLALSAIRENPTRAKEISNHNYTAIEAVIILAMALASMGHKPDAIQGPRQS